MGHARFYMQHLSCAEHAQCTAVQLGAPLSITSAKDAPFANLAKAWRVTKAACKQAHSVGGKQGMLRKGRALVVLYA